MESPYSHRVYADILEDLTAVVRESRADVV